MAAIQFTADDRDEQGFIKVPAAPPIEPRLLADLLPTTDHRPPTTRVSPTRQELLSAAIIVPLLIGALLYLSSGRYAAPPVVRQPTAAPAALEPTPNPQPPTPIPVVMLPAYGAPNEAPRWQIEATRAITPTAHYGADWIQADVNGSGLIWLRAADFRALGIVGPDLAPRPTIAPVYQQAPEPPPAPPAPTQCAEVGVAGKQSRSCGTEDLSVLQERAKQLWVAAFGGNIGSGDMHPTPQIRNSQ